MQTTMWCTCSVFSSATRTGAAPGSSVELECRLPRVREQALLEPGVDPGTGHEARALGGRARDEPVDPLRAAPRG